MNDPKVFQNAVFTPPAPEVSSAWDACKPASWLSLRTWFGSKKGFPIHASTSGECIKDVLSVPVNGTLTGSHTCTPPYILRKNGAHGSQHVYLASHARKLLVQRQEDHEEHDQVPYYSFGGLVLGALPTGLYGSSSPVTRVMLRPSVPPPPLSVKSILDTSP
ncbi:hypothetical protein Cgig2_001145 [Carnegiea gigantea]|uniref:Uncharacterized protein n=1 Tax=Carnegiea gigantea TaxID=171969 RepID=A0A9Q1K3K7_9CARY|nr:hypothetical protein Cgig2_001145 [Carnegiea gigantea]